MQCIHEVQVEVKFLDCPHKLAELSGKTLSARAVANRTDACFIRVIGSELVQKYVGEGARMVRELFEMARTKKACLIFFDEIDAVGGARFDDGAGGDNEVQRTMLELINQGRNVFETSSSISVVSSIVCSLLGFCPIADVVS